MRCLVLTALLTCAAISQSAVIISISSPADLSAIAINENVTVNIELVSLPQGLALDFLAATVEFDSTLLSDLVVLAGPIVPNPSFPAFDSSALPGVADASYDSAFDASSQVISETGIFASFSIQGLSAGAGTFSITFADAAVGFDPQGVNIEVRELAYRVVPEMHPIVFVMLAFTTFLSFRTLQELRTFLRG